MKKFSLVVVFSHLALFNSTKAFSQNSKDTLQLEEVVVTAGRTPSRYIETARSITVVTAEQLKQTPAKSINDVLENFAGVDIKQRGPAGVQADISIRGESFENVLILVNGIRVNDPQTGHHNLNLPVALEDIERIEILRGSAARIHGQNAFSGVINFITKKPADKNIMVKGSAGDFGFYQGLVSISAPIKKYKQNISLSRAASNGYRHNTDFGLNNIFYQANLQTGKIEWNANAGFNDKQFGGNGFYAAAYPDQWEATQTAFAHISAQTSGKWIVKPNLYWRRNTDEFLLKRGNPLFYKNLHTTNIFGADISTTRSWKFGTTNFGAEARKEQIVSTNLGNHHRYNSGLFIDHRVLLFNKLTINPGLYLSWYSDYGTQLYPGVDASYLVHQNLALYGSVNRAYRVPTYTELYYKDPQNLSNPDLKPEEALSYEAGFRLNKKGYALNSAIFQKQGNNIIDWTRANASDKWQVQNIAQITTSGVEAMFQVKPAALMGNNFFIKEFSLQYTYLNTNKQQSEALSKYVFDYLNHQLIFGLQHKLPFGINQSWRVRFEERMGYSPYWLVDARMSKEIKHFTLFADATNLFNQKYFEFANIPMPGRWVTGGFSWHWK